MSGIAGIVDFTGAPIADGLIEAMTAAMAMHARDGITHAHAPHARLGYCALYTTAEAASETQPLHDEDTDSWLLFDGWLSNRAELLSELACPTSTGEAAVALAAWKRWGADFVTRLEGPYALALWDARERVLLLAKDHTGTRPLFVARQGDRVVFATELGAIHAAGHTSYSVNEDVLVEYLCWHPLSVRETLWHGIERVLPAETQVHGADGALRRVSYWEPTPIDLAGCSLADVAERHRALLFDLVRRYGRSQAPVAFEVSGGLDSTALFAVGCALRDNGRWPAPELLAYTLRFPAGTAADEAQYALAAGEKSACPVHAVDYSMKPIEWYRERMHRLKAPPGEPNLIMQAGLLEAMHAAGARVAMGGIGGDEYLAGTQNTYDGLIQGGRWRDLVRQVAHHRAKDGSIAAIRRLLLHGAIPHGMRAALRRWQLSRQDVVFDWLASGPRKRFNQRLRDVRATNPNQFTMQDGHRLLQDLVRNPVLLAVLDGNAPFYAEFGLEARSPFLAKDMGEFSLGIPESFKYLAPINKVYHRQALHDLLPECVLRRTDKAEFSHVLDPRVHLADIAIPHSELLAPDALQTLVKLSRTGRASDARWYAFAWNMQVYRKEGLIDP